MKNRRQSTKAREWWYLGATLLGFAAFGTVSPGKEVTIVTSGPSMLPTLPVEPTWVVVDTGVRWQDLKKGDVVVYHRNDGTGNTVHRLFKRTKDGRKWWARGDGCWVPDREWVTEGKLYGRVVGVWREDPETGTVRLERGGMKGKE